jgi:hypothetical protein
MQEGHRVLRKIIGPKRDQVTGVWRRLHNEELDDLHCWPNIIQIMKNEMGGAFGSYGRKDWCVQGLVGRTEGKKTHERRRRRWDYNIKIYLQDMG